MTEQLLLPGSRTHPLSQVESLALVQIFLNASLACIAHTRELIPWTSTCFQTRYVDQISFKQQLVGQSLYTMFQNRISETSLAGQEIKILTHGGHRRADQILGLLEEGVFDALERGYLDSLQVLITRNTDATLSVREAYKFLFAYKHGSVSSVTISPGLHRTFVLDDAQKSFKTAIRALLRTLRDLPRLPARRKLGMSLAYNQACPIVYQPAGFVDVDEFQSGGAGELCKSLMAEPRDLLATMDAGPMNVRIAIEPFASLQESSVDMQDTVMSKQLRQMQKTSSSHSNNLLSTLPEPLAHQKRVLDVHDPATKRLKVAVTRKTTRQSSQQPVIGPFSQRLQDTSSLPSKASKEAREPADTGVRVRLSSTKFAHLVVHCYAIQNGKAGSAAHVFEPDLLAAGTIKRLIRSDRVGCACGDEERTSNMLYCEICDTWHHELCYGYHANLDGEACPEVHFCYECMLYTDDQVASNSPLVIVLLRKVTSYLLDNAKPGTRVNDTFLQAKLKPRRWTNTILEQVFARLVEVQLLTQQSARVFELQSLGQTDLATIRSKFVGPLASIEHFFEVVVATTFKSTKRHDLMASLEAYADGRDYTIADGCEELVTRDEFGEEVVYWGYRPRSVVVPATCDVDEMVPVTPHIRRKISFSRTLINVDCSPSAASMTSVEDLGSPCRDDVTDFSTAETTAATD